MTFYLLRMLNVVGASTSVKNLLAQHFDMIDLERCQSYSRNPDHSGLEEKENCSFQVLYIDKILTRFVLQNFKKR